jgi:hypothetical protein
MKMGIRKSKEELREVEPALAAWFASQDLNQTEASWVAMNMVGILIGYIARSQNQDLQDLEDGLAIAQEIITDRAHRSFNQEMDGQTRKIDRPTGRATSVKSDDIRLLEELEAAAVNKQFGGHLTIMRFTTSWRVSFETPNCRCDVDRAWPGKTFAEAATAALRANRRGELSYSGSPYSHDMYRELSNYTRCPDCDEIL